MALYETLIREENDGTISFGDYTLDTKSKVNDFEHNGDLYKVKTFYEITKLEKNGMFLYESVPGTAVYHLNVSEKEVSFLVSGSEDAQITLELEPEKEYRVFINETNIGRMKTNLGGKLVISTELSTERQVQVRVVKS